MREDSQVTMTLAIANHPCDLLVIGVSGRDGLNAPYCFDIDLVSRDATLDGPALLLRDAWLQIGVEMTPMHGLHGQIQGVDRLYRGSALSLYRLRLMPALQRLDGPPRRRAFNGKSVPQILTRLLHSHGMAGDAVRFDHLLGLYPPRQHCLQYNESDLHFLRRLCEEEGISFRFEHHLQRHVLVFSDDPLGFPEWLTPAGVDHLAEQLSVRTCYSSHAGEHYSPPTFAPRPRTHDADNQAFGTALATDAAVVQRQQLSARQLERQRCERREIMGHSRLPWMRAGLVMRVEEHPDTFFNDQWLLTDVQHWAWQLAPLRGCESRDVIQMLQAMASADDPGRGVARLLRPRFGLDKPKLAGYENSFRVLPWTMPFRPALEHLKPIVDTYEMATLVDEHADASGRLRIRYHWQADAPTSGADDSWARVVSGLKKQPCGSRVRIGFFEGDPDQPLISGTLAAAPDTTGPPGTAADKPQREENPGACVASGEGRQLRIDSDRPLTLRSSRGWLHITEQGIDYAPFAAVDEPDQRPLGPTDA